MSRNNNGAHTSEADKSVRELEADIARTREAISGDVDELAQQLNPDRYKAQVQAQAQGTLQSAQDAVMASVQEVTDSMVERSKEASSGVVETIRNHPVPVTLVGLGLALLAVGGGVRHTDDDANDTDDAFSGAYEGGGYGQPSVGARTGHTAYSHDDRYAQDQAEQLRRSDLEPDTYGSYRSRYGSDRYSAYESGYDTGTSVGGTGEGRVAEGSTGDSTFGGRAGKVGDQAGRQARRRGRGLANFVEEHPLAAGVLTVLAGAAVGLALPGTRKEDELLGDAKGNLAGQARSAALRAREVAQKTFDEAKETAKHEFSGHEEGTEKDAQGLLQKGKEAVRKVANDASETAKREADKQNLR